AHRQDSWRHHQMAVGRRHRVVAQPGVRVDSVGTMAYGDPATVLDGVAPVEYVAEMLSEFLMPVSAPVKIGLASPYSREASAALTVRTAGVTTRWPSVEFTA